VTGFWNPNLVPMAEGFRLNGLLRSNLGKTTALGALKVGVLEAESNPPRVKT